MSNTKNITYFIQQMFFTIVMRHVSVNCSPKTQIPDFENQKSFIRISKLNGKKVTILPTNLTLTS